MKQNVSEYDFTDAFRNYGREDNFSPAGLRALYNYLIELEEDCDMNIEFDMVALCCEYSEYETAHEAASEYFEYEGMHFDEEGNETETAEEVEEKAIKFLQDRTQLIVFGSGVIIQDF